MLPRTLSPPEGYAPSDGDEESGGAAAGEEEEGGCYEGEDGGECGEQARLVSVGQEAPAGVDEGAEGGAQAEGDDGDGLGYAGVYEEGDYLVADGA